MFYPSWIKNIICKQLSLAAMLNGWLGWHYKLMTCFPPHQSLIMAKLELCGSVVMSGQTTVYRQSRVWRPSFEGHEVSLWICYAWTLRFPVLHMTRASFLTQSARILHRHCRDYTLLSVETLATFLYNSETYIGNLTNIFLCLTASGCLIIVLLLCCRLSTPFFLHLSLPPSYCWWVLQNGVALYLCGGLF